MKLTRMAAILGGALAIMLIVVILRAESTRLHHELAGLHQRADLLWQQVSEEELELARMRNPELIRARAAELRLESGRSGAQSVAPASDLP